MVVLMFIVAPGCQWKGQPPPDPVEDPAAAPAAPSYWQIKPARLRVYPSTRIVQRQDHAVLEARIEFFDDLDDSVKSVGQLRFELYAVNRTREAIVGSRLYNWDVAMLTKQDNHLFFDPVTRAYLFRLRLDDAAIARKPLLLRVIFMPPTGPRLEAEAIVSPEGGPAQPAPVGPG